MQIPLIYEHLFCKYFVLWSVGHATKGINFKIQKRDFLVCYFNCWKSGFFSNYFCFLFSLFLLSTFCLPYIILMISKSFATHGCCQLCCDYIQLKGRVAMSNLVILPIFALTFTTQNLLTITSYNYKPPRLPILKSAIYW